MKNTLFLITILFLSFTAMAQSVSFEDPNLTKSYTSYLNLKDALVLADSESAKQSAEELKASLIKTPDAQKALATVNQLIAARTVKEQRTVFTTLSNEIIALVKSAKVTSGEVYVAYCPMANQNSGGFWLSNQKEIKNPYFGKMMLSCGSVKETLK